MVPLPGSNLPALSVPGLIDRDAEPMEPPVPLQSARIVPKPILRPELERAVDARFEPLLASVREKRASSAAFSDFLEHGSTGRESPGLVVLLAAAWSATEEIDDPDGIHEYVGLGCPLGQFFEGISTLVVLPVRNHEQGASSVRTELRLLEP